MTTRGSGSEVGRGFIEIDLLFDSEALSQKFATIEKELLDTFDLEKLAENNEAGFRVLGEEIQRVANTYTAIAQGVTQLNEEFDAGEISLQEYNLRLGEAKRFINELETRPGGVSPFAQEETFKGATLALKNYINEQDRSKQFFDKGAISAERMRSQIFQLGQGFASGRADVVAFNFATQELSNALIRGSLNVKQFGGGLTGLVAAAKGFGSALAKSLGPLLLIGAAVAAGTALFTRWKKGQEEAKKATEDWTKALIEGEQAADKYAASLVRTRIESGDLSDDIINTGVSLELLERAFRGDADAIAELESGLQGTKDSISALLAENEAYFDVNGRNNLALLEQVQVLQSARNSYQEILNQVKANAGALEDATVRADLFRESLTFEAGATLFERVNVGLESQATLFDAVKRNLTDIPALIGLFADEGSRLSGQLLTINNNLEDDGNLREFITLLERQPQTEGVKALIDLVNQALDEQQTELEELEGQREEERQAAEEAEKEKRRQLEETLAVEREQTEAIRERIQTRLEEGNLGLQLIGILRDIGDNEQAIADAAKTLDPQDDVDAALARLELLQRLGSILGEEDSTLAFSELIDKIQFLVDSGALDQSVADTILGEIDRVDDFADAYDRIIDADIESVIGKFDLFRLRLQDADLEAEELQGRLLQLAGAEYIATVRLETTGDSRVVDSINGGFVTGGGIQGRAFGGRILPGQVALVGENGPELATGDSNGGLITAPFGGGTTSTGPSITINNPRTNDIVTDTEQALRLVRTADLLR